MSFSVETADLDAYGGQVGRAAEDAEAIKQYVDKYGSHLQGSTVDQGLFLAGLDLHEDAMNKGKSALGRVHTLLDRSSDELTKSSTYYEQTDRTQAEELDATYPGSKRGTPKEGVKQSFTDTADPSAELKAPSTPENFSHGPINDGIETLSNWLSPTYWSLEAIKFVFQAEKDPLEQALDWFTGDWAEYAKCGEMWSNSGSAMNAVSANIANGNAKLDASWDGNAADTAYVYFSELSKEIDKLGDNLKDLETHYTQLALAVFEGMNTVKGILSAMADSLILIELEVAAGTLLAETGVGLLIGYGAAIYEVTRVIRLWGKATATYTSTMNAVKAAVSASSLLTGSLGISLQKLPAPGESYDHPAV